MKHKFLAIAGLLIILLAISLPGLSSAGQPATIADLLFRDDAFPNGSGYGYVVMPDGLTMADTAVTSLYTSPILQTPISFNAVVPQWIADVDETADMEIRLRTKTTAGPWSQWFDIRIQPDWTLPDDPDVVGGMVGVPAADVVHQYVQFSIRFGRDQGIAAPVLNQLRLTFLNTSAGPTAEEMVAQQKALDAAREQATGADPNLATDSYPRPTVVSREVWCTAPDCDYTDGIYYEPVTHMVIHHTVSANDSSDWAAIVRAIWNFHTYSRGWGDVGYNYLVDMDGVIYEGHNNEDYLNQDVIGTHAAVANAGGLGVALIGTFTTPEEYSVSAVPPPEMMTATATLLAWKADQRHIDIYDASRMVNTNWGLPHLMGHRDVYGGLSTLCPGGEAYDLLPWLRDEVAAQLNFVSPYIYVDELSTAFTKSNNNWYEGPRGCGNNGHAYYTWSVDDPAQSTNWGEWRPDVPVDGRYTIEVYAPYCNTGGPETTSATYTITHTNGVDTVIADHNANVGLWMSLGEFDLQAGNSTVLRLTDLTADSGKGVWFDGIRLRQVPVSVTNATPLADIWLNQPAIDFTWTISNPASVQTTTLQVATNTTFTDTVAMTSWGTAVTSHTYTLTQDYPDLYWQVVLTSTFGDRITSDPTRFGLDTTPPTSTVSSLYYYPASSSYELFWQGNDTLSGVDNYNIDIRADGALTWTRFLTNTALTTTIFTPPDPDQTYWFRSQAADAAGNVESPHAGDGDLNTTQAVAVTIPQVSNETPAADAWQNDPAVTFSWAVTDTAVVQTTTLRIAANATFTDTIVVEQWATAVTSHTYTFTQDYPDLYWQVFATNSYGYQGASASTRFGLDTVWPTSTVTSLYDHAWDGTFEIFWQGNDDLSGVASYNIDVRAGGTLTWTQLLTNTVLTTTIFTPPDPGQPYWFRSQAIDAAGNVETPHTGDGDMSTAQAILLYDPQVQNQSPADALWLNDAAVTYNWELVEVSNVQTTTLQVAADADFADLLFTAVLTDAVISYTHTLSQDYASLYWQVTAEFIAARAGLTNTVSSLPTMFGLDTAVPTSTITVIYQLNNGYLLQWDGSDALSGVAAYYVEYRADGDTTWTRWLTATTETSSVFTPPDPAQVYWFRTQAADAAGNIEPPLADATWNTEQATPLPYAIMLPIVTR